MVTAVTPEMGLDIAVPERLLIATADTLPDWLRTETLGRPKLPSYSADRPFHGVWEFRAGRGYYELDFIPDRTAQRSTTIALAVRVIDGVTYAAVRPGLTTFPLPPELLRVLIGIDTHTKGLLRKALFTQLHAIAERQGRGVVSIDISLTRRLHLLLSEGTNG